MNWTTAETSYWQTKCDAFSKASKPFQLRDVKSKTQEAFAILYALQSGFDYERDGSTVTFSPNRKSH
ncbi:MAG TPA: hypothetical protein VK633_02140 [Verrucomicrobiae bacterium]|nr:hypothetical protein [Verrucomicrobiae bacterium]